MILTRQKILSEIRKKRIVIEPFDQSAIGPASVDLTLGDEIRVFVKKKSLCTIDDSADYKKETRKIKLGRGYVLMPGELVLGITKEKITLATNICGWLQSRSRFARLGLMSHITAPFVLPGVSNRQVLEIFNAGPHRLKLIPGTKICQIVFQECKGRAKYLGIFRNQEL